MSDFILELIGGIFDVASEIVIALVAIFPKLIKFLVWVILGIFILPLSPVAPKIRTRWLGWNGLQ